MFVALTSCSEEQKVQIPADVIPQEEFIEIYSDALLIEAAYKQRLYKKEDPEVWLGKRYGELFEKRDVDAEKYQHSVEWYSSQTQLFHDMHDGIMERLNKLEAAQNIEENP